MIPKRVLCIGICLIFFYTGCGLFVGKQPQQLPDFELPQFGAPQEMVRLSSWTERGPVLLAFWASWCPTCAAEVPQLNQIHNDFQSNSLKVLAVNVEEPKRKIATFQEQYPMDYTVLMDSSGDVAGSLGLTGLPVVILLAKEGEIVYYGFSLPPDISRYIV